MTHHTRKTKYKELYDQKMNDGQIARIMGISRYETRRIRIMLELPPHTSSSIRVSVCHRNTWKSNRKSIRSEPSLPVERYEENGMTITKCPPAYAVGAWPQKNVGVRL